MEEWKRKCTIPEVSSRDLSVLCLETFYTSPCQAAEIRAAVFTVCIYWEQAGLDQLKTGAWGHPLLFELWGTLRHLPQEKPVNRERFTIPKSSTSITRSVGYFSKI